MSARGCPRANQGQKVTMRLAQSWRGQLGPASQDGLFMQSSLSDCLMFGLVIKNISSSFILTSILNWKINFVVTYISSYKKNL